MIRLVSQGGTVLGHVVIGLRHINDSFLVQGESVPVEGPIPAVNLQDIGKQPCSERAFLTKAHGVPEALTTQIDTSQ